MPDGVVRVLGQLCWPSDMSLTFGHDLKSLLFVRRFSMQPVDLSNPRVLARNLHWLYHLMVASENLLLVAAASTFQEGPPDPLHLYFMEHLEEERGHAEWLKADLAEAGLPVGPVPREVMLTVGVQYYLIYHVQPALLLLRFAFARPCW